MNGINYKYYVTRENFMKGAIFMNLTRHIQTHFLFCAEHSYLNIIVYVI